MERKKDHGVEEALWRKRTMERKDLARPPRGLSAAAGAESSSHRSHIPTQCPPPQPGIVLHTAGVSLAAPALFLPPSHHSNRRGRKCVSRCSSGQK